MKHNLKNCPKVNPNLGFSVYNDPHKLAKWFEGFEKELREIIEWKGTPLKPEWIEQLKGQKKLAKEILG